MDHDDEHKLAAVVGMAQTEKHPLKDDAERNAAGPCAELSHEISGGSRGWTEERDPVFISAEVDWRAAWNRRGMCLKSLGYERRHDRGHLNEH